MEKEKIRDMIDRRIVQFFGQKMDIPSMQIDIFNKMEKFSNTIKEASFDIDVISKMDYEKISPLRIRYAMFYIKYSKQRIEDLEWVAKNKHKFKKYSYFQVYKLVIFKEKLSIETCIENEKYLPF